MTANQETKAVLPEIVASLPALASAPFLRPFMPGAFAAWAIGGGLPWRSPDNDAAHAARTLALAGFVLSFVPQAERSETVRALAWPSPADERMLARALVLLHEPDRVALLAWVRGEWLAETRAAVEAAIGRTLSPQVAARVLRLDDPSTEGERLTAVCPRALARAHRFEIFAAQDGAARFTCESCGTAGDALALVALARGIDPQHRAAVVREAAQLAAGVL